MTARWVLQFAVALCGCSNVLGIEEGIEKGSACDRQGALMCDAFQPVRCDAKRWRHVGPKCAHSCRDGECVEAPPSCKERTPTTNGSECCETLWVPGGDFHMRQDAQMLSTSYPRSVSGFFLDRFEVTVIRFQQFVDEYPESLPQPGQGAPPGLPEFGWNSEWLTEEGREDGVDENLAIPTTRQALEESLAACEGSTFQKGSHTLPINCINWYIAFAFCVWDGGRLPTEAEWQFTAGYGDEQRVYPWSVPPYDEYISAEHAWYDNLDSPGLVDMKPAGRAALLFRQSHAHEDMAGNVAEWVLDGNGEPDSAPHSDSVTNWTTSRRVMRGGSYARSAGALKNSVASELEAAALRPLSGVRCARDAQTQREVQ